MMTRLSGAPCPSRCRCASACALPRRIHVWPGAALVPVRAGRGNRSPTRVLDVSNTPFDNMGRRDCPDLLIEVIDKRAAAAIGAEGWHIGG
jgi:hypothetical protein